MGNIKLGILREGKVPPDFRVPLTPNQCSIVAEKFPSVEIIVQSSPIRSFSDALYTERGFKVQEDMSECDILIGVKEVQIADLIPNKKYMFFSHTIKKQSYNRELLRTVLERKIQLIDYEALKNRIGKRLIGFGRYAGIVGCYNGFRAYGLKHKTFELKAANQCHDRVEMENELKKVILPSDAKIILTGFGRVGYGAREIMNLLPIIEVSPEEYLTQNFKEPVFTHLEIDDYFARKVDEGFDKKEFYAEPEKYKSVFVPYAALSDMYVSCHFWSNKSPFILTRADLKSNTKLKVVADVSCDIDGPIACTLRPSTIANPFFGYDKQLEKEVDYMEKDAMIVMSVDNLPCELPKDASEDFGNELINNIFPVLPIACTLRPSTIANPFFGYDKQLEKEVDYMEKDAMIVMSVDNLPCELPKDASEDFGNELINNIFPVLFGEDPDNVIGRGSETNLNGELTENFKYLEDYVNGEKVRN